MFLQCNSFASLQSLYGMIHSLASITHRQVTGFGTEVKDVQLAGLSAEVETEVKVISLLPISSSPQHKRSLPLYLLHTIHVSVGFDLITLQLTLFQAEEFSYILLYLKGCHSLTLCFLLPPVLSSSLASFSGD